MVLYGPLLSRMVPYGPEWSCMIQYGPVWSPMVLYCMVPNSPKLSCMVQYDPLMSPVVPCCPSLSHVVPCGPVWSCMFPYGPIWSLSYCPMWMYMVMFVPQGRPLWGGGGNIPHEGTVSPHQSLPPIQKKLSPLHWQFGPPPNFSAHFARNSLFIAKYTQK